MLLEPAPVGEGGTVIVKLDGSELRRIEVSADDLFAAALALRDIELGSMPPGEHTLEVSYDGSLKARVALAVDRWIGSGTPAAAPAAAPAEGSSVAVSRDLPAEVEAGEPVVLEFDVQASGVLGPLVLEQPLPAGTRLNPQSRSGSERATVLSTGDDDGVLVLGLPPGSAGPFTVRLDTDRAGTVAVPPAVLRAPLQSELEARTSAATLVVR